MVDQVCVDHILQVPSPVVWQQDVDDLGPGIRAISRVGNRVVDGRDDVLVWGEEGVCLGLFERLGDGFLAKGTADFLESEQLAGARVLDEVDVGEATLRKLGSAIDHVGDLDILYAFRCVGSGLRGKFVPPREDAGV